MIHSNIPLIMKIRKKTVRQLCDETGIDEFTIQKARKGETIDSCRLKSLYTIAKALDVDLDDLSVKIQCKCEQQ